MAGVSLVVTRCHTSEFLDLCEVVFDQMPPLVHVRIVVSLHFSVRFGRDDSGCVALIKLLWKPICIERLVGQQRAKGSVADLSCRASVPAAGGNEAGFQAHRPRPRFWLSARRENVRWPDTESPFCARSLLVGLHNRPVDEGAYSKSGLPLIVLKRLSNTPFSVQRRNRLN